MSNRREQGRVEADSDIEGNAHRLGISSHGGADPMAAVVHIAGHARMAPRWDQLVADLMLAGYSIRMIARRVQSSRSNVHRMLTDPRAGPGFELGMRLVLFHARVQQGIEQAPGR